MPRETKLQLKQFEGEVAVQIYSKPFSKLTPIQKQVVVNIVESKRTLVDINFETKRAQKQFAKARQRNLRR